MLQAAMPTRRQQKVARVIREAVSDAIANHLNDPRIAGFVSVTRLDVTANLRSADVYLSVFGQSEKAQRKTFSAINHARSRIQSILARKIESRFCPVLRLHKDESFKKTLQTMELIDKVADELKQKDSIDPAEN